MKAVIFTMEAPIELPAWRSKVAKIVGRVNAQNASDLAATVPNPFPEASVNDKRRLKVAIRRPVEKILPRRLAAVTCQTLEGDEHADFTEEDVEIWHTFMNAWEIKGRAWFEGREIPGILACSLVSVTKPGNANSSPQTYICIKGLVRGRDIANAHAVFSQMHVKEFYKPLQICFDKHRITTAAAGEKFVIDADGKLRTLCGATVRRTSDGRSSTLGGIIQVNGILYAVTTSHDAAGDTSGYSSGSSGGDEIDVRRDAELTRNVPIISQWQVPKDIRDIVPSEEISDEYAPSRSNWPHLGTTQEQGSDWCLITIQDERLMVPNVFRVDCASSEGAIGSSAVDDPMKVPHSVYITKFDDSKARRVVHIASGRSGRYVGLLSQNFSYLKLTSGSWIKTLTVHFSEGRSLTTGDSGSWVFDLEAKSLIGQVLAVSEGLVYVLPIATIVKEIQVRIPHCRVRLPSPFTLLADLAKHCYSSSDADLVALSKQYAREAASQSVFGTLILSSTELKTADDAARFLHYLPDRITSGAEREIFANVILRTGADVLEAAETPEQWAAQYPMSGEALTLLRNLGLIYQQVFSAVTNARTNTPSYNRPTSVLMESARLKHRTEPANSGTSETDYPAASRSPRNHASKDPLLFWTVEQLKEDVARLRMEFNIDCDLNILLRGAQLARSDRSCIAIENIPDMTDAERAALDGESRHQFRQPKSLVIIILVGVAGAIFHGWEQAAFNGALLSWPEEFKLDTSSPQGQVVKGLTTAGVLLGNGIIGYWLPCCMRYVSGHYVSGRYVSGRYVSGRYVSGRRGTLFVSALCCVALIIGEAFTQHEGELFAVRIILGAASGSLKITLALLTWECSPRRIRGKVFAILSIGSWLGFVLGSTVSLAVMNLQKPPWRLQVGCSFLPLILLLWSVFLGTESPWYFMNKEQYKSAYNILKSLRSTEVQAARDFLLLYYQRELEGKLIGQSWRNVTIYKEIRDLFALPRLRRATLASSTMMITHGLCGVAVFLLYASSILKSQGASDKLALLLSLVFGFVTFLWALPATRLIDRGRKFLFLSLLLLTPSLIATGLSFFINTKYSTSVRLGVITTFISIFGAVYSVLLGAIGPVYAAESYSLVHREVGLAFAMAIESLAGGVAVLTFPVMTSTLKEPATFGIYGGMLLVGTVAIFLLAPETAGMNPEELDSMFSTPFRKHVQYRIMVTLPWILNRYILRRDGYPPKPYFRMVRRRDGVSDEEIRDMTELESPNATFAIG